MRLGFRFSVFALLSIDACSTKAFPLPRDPRMVSHDHHESARIGARSLQRGAVPATPNERQETQRADTKYFHEPGGNDLLGHYDIRYFKELDTYENRQETQLHMLRAYLEFFQEKGLETWLAHGTLLGWWWNEKVRRSQDNSI